VFEDEFLDTTVRQEYVRERWDEDEDLSPVTITELPHLHSGSPGPIESTKDSEDAAAPITSVKSEQDCFQVVNGGLPEVNGSHHHESSSKDYDILLEKFTALELANASLEQKNEGLAKQNRDAWSNLGKVYEVFI